jgi:hypothetical protein
VGVQYRNGDSQSRLTDTLGDDFLKSEKGFCGHDLVCLLSLNLIPLGLAPSMNVGAQTGSTIVNDLTV